MEILKEIFGEGRDLDAVHMSARAAVMFFIALVLIRVAGIKTFGKNSAYDNIIIIMLGAILSRGVTGVSPFVPVVCSGLTMSLINRLISLLCIYNKPFGRLIKGQPRSLFKNGSINYYNLHKSLLTENDLMAGVREKANTASLDDVEEVFFERSGEISVVKKISMK